jgi:hypothetical protein
VRALRALWATIDGEIVRLPPSDRGLGGSFARCPGSAAKEQPLSPSPAWSGGVRGGVPALARGGPRACPAWSRWGRHLLSRVTDCDWI